MPDRIGLAEAFEALRVELEQAAQAAAATGLRFRVDQVSVELEVVTERAVQGRAGLNFWVVEAGGQYEQSGTHTHRVTVSLTPHIASGPLYTSDDQIPE